MTESETAEAISTHPAKPWFMGFDWLRVLFIIFVLLMHLNITQILACGSTGATIWDVIYSQLLCCAVPGFLFISVFLQTVKHPQPAKPWQQIMELCHLYGFWVLAWTVLTRSYPEPTAWGVVLFLLRGGGWAYYFFTHLLLVHVLRITITHWSNRSLLLVFILTELVIGGCFWKMSHDGYTWKEHVTYWWPIAAVPIPFIASLLARYYRQIMTDKNVWFACLIGSCFLTIAAAVFEWSMSAPAATGMSRLFLPEYLRISPLLLVTTFVVGAIKIDYAPKWIEYISKNSLGIFCLHVYILGAVFSTFLNVFSNQMIASLMTLVVMLFGICFVSELLRKIFKSRIV